MKAISKPRLVFLCGKGAGDYLALEKAREVKLVDFSVSKLIIVNSASKAIPVAEAAYGTKPLIIKGWKERRQECWQHLMEQLEGISFDYILLCGFPFLLPGNMVASYEGKIINSHHSQLPFFPGLFQKELLLSSPLKFLGATLHTVDEGMDTGPVLMQAVFPNPGIEQLTEALKTYRFAQDCLVVQWLRNSSGRSQKMEKSTHSYSHGVMFVPAVEEAVSTYFGKEL